MTTKFNRLPLPELCDILSGGTPKTSVKEYWNGKIPWASVKDFNTDSRWFSNTEKTISQLGLDKCSSVLLEPGDLIMSARGTVGVVAQTKVHLAFNQSNYGLRAKNLVSTNDYLYYALCAAKAEILSDTHGGMFDTITRETLKRLLIPAPPLKVQEKVAEILSAFDELIEVNKVLSKTLEDIAQTIFKSWFIDFDPVKAKINGEKPIGMDDETTALFPAAFEESELGLIPKGWEVLGLGEVANIYQGKYLKPNQLNSKQTLETPIPVEGATKTIGYSNKSSFDFDFASVSCRGSCGFIRWITNPAWISNNLMAIYSKKDVNINHYLYFLLKSLNLEEVTTGSVQGQITINNLASVRVIHNSVIAQRFNDISKELINSMVILENQSSKLSEIRDSLLPRLISGELQIPVDMLAS